MNRIRKLQQAMPAEMEAALLLDASNRFYLTGMKSSAGAVLVTRKHAWLLIDFRYLEDAENKVRSCTVLEEKDLFAQTKQLLDGEGIRMLSIHSGLVSIDTCRKMRSAMPELTLDDSGLLAELMEQLRMQKEEEEIDCHRRAQKITDHVFDHICGYIRPGRTELDVAREIGIMLTRLGSDDRTFQFIVASGPNSSLPHGFATNRMIRSGDFVTMDFGAVSGGYLADMTRTVAVGRVSDEQREVYETVLEAQKRAIGLIRPGAICRMVDAAAREYIYSRGFRGCFSHGLGHSVGVEVHENPRLNEVCESSLVPGIVITVEPGIYLKKKFGVRIEDMVVVRGDGCENLTESPKNLLIL